MNLEDLYMKIVNSAKLRLDWSDFENQLIELSGPKLGSELAEHVLIQALGELSLGKKEDDVARELDMQFRGMNCMSHLAGFVADVNKMCQSEIKAFINVRWMSEISNSCEEIYQRLRPELLESR